MLLELALNHVKDINMVGIALGTNGTFLVADLFVFCYERYSMLSLSGSNYADQSTLFQDI